MSTSIAFYEFRDQPPPRLKPSVIKDYKQAHQEMLCALSAMEELSSKCDPNQLRLSHTRLRITRASYECRAALANIVRVLSLRKSPIVDRKVATIERTHLELRAAARQHLTKWTHEQARIDWLGYCQSSAEVRQLWRKAIDREREMLYPLL